MKDKNGEAYHGHLRDNIKSPTVLMHDGRVNIDLPNGKAVVFSDAHYWPGLVSTAHRALILFIKKYHPEIVVCNGDAFDGSTISRFPRIGWDSKPTVLEELKTVQDRLGELEAASKGRLIWTLGNHDARYETFLASRVPEYQGIGGFSLKDSFPRWQPCWSCWINENTVIKHRYKGGVHAPHNNTIQAGLNVVTGHLHMLKHAPFTDYTGTRHGVDTGTLADPNGPQFMDYTEDNPKNWRSGFVVLTFWNGEMLWPEFVSVKDEAKGEVVFRGEVYYV